MTRIPSDLRIRRRKGEAGYLIVTAALSIFLLFGLIGLAIDVGQLRLAQRNLQNAADAAAIAGGAEILFSDLTTAAYAAAAGNGGSTTQLGACPISSGTSGVCVSHPPVDGPHSGDTNYVEVMAAQNQPTFFMGVVGANPVWLSARAVASASSPNCIYALGTGGGTGFFGPAPNMGLFIADVHSQCGAVDAGDFSELIGCLVAPSIGVVGSVNNFFGCNRTVQKINQVIDPFGCSGGTCVPAPYVGPPTSCAVPPASPIPPGTYQAMTISPGNNVTFSGGGTYVFCNGLTINGGNVTFGAGTYVMYGGGFQMSNTFGGQVSGNGVLIYNTGSGTAAGTCPPTCAYGPISTFFTGGNALVAPTSGTYAGILFFQDRSNPTQANFNANFSFQNCNPGNTNPFLQGAYYFPDAQVNFLFDFGCGAQYSILVAQSIEWDFAFTFNNDYSSLPGGNSPIRNTGVLSE